MLRLFRRLCCCSRRKPDPEELFIVTWKGGIQLEELENMSPAKEITSEANLLVPAPPQLLTRNSNSSDSPLHVANSNHIGDGNVETPTDNLLGTSMFQSIDKDTNDTLLKAKSCLLFVESVEAIDVSVNIEYATNNKKDFTVINGHTVDEMAIDTSYVEQGASVPELIVKDIINHILADSAQQILYKETEEIAKASPTAINGQFVDGMSKHATGVEQGSNVSESIMKGTTDSVLKDAAQQMHNKESEEIVKAKATAVNENFVDGMPKGETCAEEGTNLAVPIVKDIINSIIKNAAQQMIYKETEKIVKSVATAINRNFVDGMDEGATCVEQCTNLVESVVEDVIHNVPKDTAQQMPYKETEEIEKNKATAINGHFVDGMPKDTSGDV